MGTLKFQCKKCEKPIEINTFISDGIFLNHKDLNEMDKLMIEGSVTVCSACKTENRISKGEIV